MRVVSNLGDVIKAARVRQFPTLSAAALMLQMSPQQLTQLESRPGNLSVRMVARLCTVFSTLTPEQFFVK